MKNPMPLLLLAFWLAGSHVGSATACSTFVLKNGDLQVFGRNYDWGLGDALLMVNKRGCRKTGIANADDTGKPATWTATFGSVTFLMATKP